MNWYNGSIPEAVMEAKTSHKLFLVYIEGTDDMSKIMTSTYNDPTISQKLTSGNVIALKLAANSVPYVQFCAIYPVIIIPSSYFIGENGAPIEIITGSLLPCEFSAKIDKVFEIFEKSLNAKKENKPTEASTSNEETVTAPYNSPGNESVSSSEGASTSQPVEDAAVLEDRVKRAKTLLESQREMKAMEEKEKEKRDELERRNVGKALQQAQQAKHDNELKEWAKNRAKEKEEERLAREKVKAMIAQDRAERAAKYQLSKQEEQAQNDRLTRMREEQERAARNAAVNCNEARIQFRLPDGSCATHCFTADSCLEDARRFVVEEVRPPFSNFVLCTSFPRRHFTESNYSETLRDLQLVPSALLLILPDQAVTSVNRNTGFLTNLFWMLISPFASIWRLVASFFPGNSGESSRTPPTEVPSNVQQTSASTSQSDHSNSRQSAQREREPNFYKRDGNVFRINNQSDDEENNTYNGNSTQQM